MDFTIEQTTLECYKIKGKNGSFATITLDYSGKQGRISIASDFGTWSFFWGACGSSFKEFLIGLNMDYAAGKFGEDNWFDEQATIRGLKERINEYAERDPDLKKVLKRELNELSEMSSRDEFMLQLQISPNILRMEDHCPDMVRTISPGFRRFWETQWKFFVDALREELETVQPA